MNEYAAAVLRSVNEAQKGMVLQSLRAAGSTIRSGLSSGSTKLNHNLSGNPLIGFVWGRIVEIFGPEQSGKTTLTLHLIHEAQKLGLPAVFIDAEHSLDPVYAESVGINLDDLLINQPECGEEAIGVLEASILAGAKLIVVDSVAALTPRAELEGEVGDANIGKQARLMGQAMRKIKGRIAKAQCLVVFINQLREKVGVVFGSNETTPGGKALKFFADYRLDVRSPRGGATQEKDASGTTAETGIDTNIKIVKNKLYPPFKRCTTHIVYGQGIDRYLDLAEFIAESQGVKGKARLQLGGRSYRVKSLAAKLHESRQLRRHALDYLKSFGQVEESEDEDTEE